MNPGDADLLRHEEAPTAFALPGRLEGPLRRSKLKAAAPRSEIFIVGRDRFEFMAAMRRPRRFRRASHEGRTQRPPEHGREPIVLQFWSPKRHSRSRGRHT